MLRYNSSTLTPRRAKSKIVPTPGVEFQRLRVPIEPNGHITDTEITKVSSPDNYRVWINWNDHFPRDTMFPNSYGSFFYPYKTGYYMNNTFY